MRILLAAAALAGVSLALSPVAHATELTSVDGESFDFQDGLGGSFGTDGSMSDGTSDSYDGCYYLDVNGSRYNGSGGTAMVTMGGRQIEMPAMMVGDLSVRRVMYVPESSGNWARYLEIIENAGAADLPASVVVGGNLGSDSGTVLRTTSSGDTTLTTADTWFASDDGGSFDPPLAHVFQGTTGAIRASSVSLSGDNLNYTYDVTVPAGGRVVIMHFAIQRSSGTADAQMEAAGLIEAGDDALVGADEWVDSIANFGVAVAGAPRVTFEGPFSATEGDAIALDITVMDPEGDTATWSWDLDGDGTFGEMPGATRIDVAAGTTDGPSSLRVGVEATDGTNTAQRYRVVNIENAAPTFSSMLTTNLVSVGQRWVYAIGGSDRGGALDPLTYAIVSGPADMIVSTEGVVMWTPASTDVTMGDERVNVVLSIDDGDGGTATQELSLQVTPNRAPPALTLLYPKDGVLIADSTPRLAVQSAIDEDFDALTYFIELDDAEDFSSPSISVGPLEEGPGYTAFQVVEPLAPGRYFWRAWAFDGAAQGEIRSTSFEVAADPASVDAGADMTTDGGIVGTDAGTVVAPRSGCSVGGNNSASGWMLLLVLGALLARRRR